MAADEEDCVSYACECVRLAALTDDEVIRHHLLELARHWIAMREKEYSDACVTPQPGRGASHRGRDRVARSNDPGKTKPRRGSGVLLCRDAIGRGDRGLMPESVPRPISRAQMSKG